MYPFFARVGQISLAASLLTLAACGGGDDSSQVSTQLACDESITTGFKPDSLTSVLLIKAFKAGDPLLLSGTADASTPIAKADVCVVKLLVGPGNPGSAAAPSTSPGIGIEVWLPSKAKWNNRIHVTGGGGWIGGPAASTTALASIPYQLPFILPDAATIATVEGAVSSFTDTGHTKASGDFAMNPDGTISTTNWRDFSERAIHEQALKTKALTKAYYGREAQYAYWDGGSSSGRQGIKEAQANPADFDGIVVASPALNWTKLSTYLTYPHTVYQRDLGGTPLTAEQSTLVGRAAIDSCDMVGGQHLGYILDPSACRYDPTKDASVLCTSAGGINSSAACLSVAQATAVNKIWYGITSDGSVPDPAADNGWAVEPTGKHKWYGIPRGTSFFNGMWGVAGPALMGIGPDMVALQLEDSSLADPSFLNATGNGADGWKDLTYGQLAGAFDRGVAMQTSFANINTDSTDLGGWRSRGGKLLVWHGLNDDLIPVQGTINYYNRVASALGGFAAVQDFFRLYLVPGQGHVPMNGAANPAANPPLVQHAQMYAALTDWVEKGIVPTSITIASETPGRTGIVCPYPQKITYVAGDLNQAGSYACQ